MLKTNHTPPRLCSFGLGVLCLAASFACTGMVNTESETKGGSASGGGVAPGKA
jgi:hypothetical protein